MREPKWIMNMKGRSKKNLDARTSSMGHGSLKCVLSANRNAVCFNSHQSSANIHYCLQLCGADATHFCFTHLKYYCKGCRFNPKDELESYWGPDNGT